MLTAHKSPHTVDERQCVESEPAVTMLFTSTCTLRPAVLRPAQQYRESERRLPAITGALAEGSNKQRISSLDSLQIASRLRHQSPVGTRCAT